MSVFDDITKSILESGIRFFESKLEVFRQSLFCNFLYSRTRMFHTHVFCFFLSHFQRLLFRILCGRLIKHEWVDCHCSISSGDWCQTEGASYWTHKRLLYIFQFIQVYYQSYWWRKTCKNEPKQFPTIRYGSLFFVVTSEFDTGVIVLRLFWPFNMFSELSSFGLKVFLAVVLFAWYQLLSCGWSMPV